jgi:hypothetical protein
MMTAFAWFFAAALALALGYAIFIVGSTLGLSAIYFDWRLWPAIRRARRGIRDVARQRVSNADVSSFQGATALNPGHLGFLIMTRTDEERDLLCQDSDIHRRFRGALAESGYPTDTMPVVHFRIESQESVDRNYGGDVNEAIRMP